MTLTTTIPRTQCRELLHSARLIILAVALAVVALGLSAVSALSLSASYLPKALAVFGAGAALMLRALPRHHPFQAFGPANQVTLIRGGLVALLAALIGERSADAPAMALALAIAVTALDGLDGWLARRSGMSSAFGARFDMETDALLVAVLALLAWQFGKVGAWVLLSGLMRYLFAAAALVFTRLRRPVPPSYRGKSIAVIQMLALIVAIAPWTSPELATVVAALALTGLCYSFLQDLLWVLREPLIDG